MTVWEFLLRWTFWLFVNPGWFVDRRGDWSRFSLFRFSKNFYEWEPDDSWGPFQVDTVRYPSDTAALGAGDCEDYAILVATVLRQQSPDIPVRLGFVFGRPGGHVVAFTPTRVYSSGRIHRKSYEEYLRDSEYSWGITRAVR